MLRVAVIGLGWWGKQIISCVRSSDKLKVVMGFDPAMAAGTAQAAELGLPLGNSFQSVLKDPGVDAVILATPHAMHDAQVAEAAAAGKHVFCEKPLSLTAAKARQMVGACRDKGIVLGVGHERRFEPGVEKIAAMAAAGEFGTIVAMDANFSHDKFKNFDRQSWRLSKTNAPAGAMTALGVHLTDMFISIAGPVESVYARCASRVFAPPLVDAVCATLSFRSGLTATLTCLSTTPFYGRFTVMGEKAWAELREYSNVDVEEAAILTVVTAAGERRTVALDPLNTVLLNLESWADAVAGRGAYRFTASEMINNIEVLEAIVCSAELGHPVRIDELAQANRPARTADG